LHDTTARGLGVVPVGKNGWNLIGVAILLMQSCVPEVRLGPQR